MALMQCPECGGQVSDRAAACPHCGCPIQKLPQPEVTSQPERKESPLLKPADLPSGGRNYMSDPSEKRDRNQSTSSQSPSASSSKTNFYSSSSKYSSDEIKSGVYVLAEKCVKNHLKSPSSAKFCPMSECAFEKGTDGIYSMAGTVESENTYGAMLQETWAIMAEVDGEKVFLVMLQIGDQVYFE